jgi:TIR domain
MPNIFISYRHSDARTAVAWIRDKLSQRYGSESVFEYQHHAEPSKDFRRVIGRAIRKCDVVLAIIGPNWKIGAGGNLSLQEANDWVRIELETAIQLDLPVIPVLVEDAVMPSPAELPDGLRDFSFLTASTVDTSKDFHREMDVLMATIDKVAESHEDSVDIDHAAQPRGTRTSTQSMGAPTNTASHTAATSLGSAERPQIQPPNERGRKKWQTPLGVFLIIFLIVVIIPFALVFIFGNGISTAVRFLGLLITFGVAGVSYRFLRRPAS